MTFNEFASAARTRAQRQLDGMTTNRDAMANDVMTLLVLVEQARDLLTQKAQERASADAAKTSFDGLFSDIFKEL